MLGTQSSNSNSCDPALTLNYGGGFGTITSPYLICSLAQWTYFGTNTSNWDKYFRLDSDLDFTGFTYSNFKSPGTSSDPFTGEFDGNNHTLRNLTITGGASEPVAIFLRTGGNASIHDLRLEDMILTSADRVSGLVLDHAGSGTLTLQDITITNLEIRSTTAQIEMGGLVGRSLSPLTISDVNFSGITLNMATNSSDVGGLVGSCAAVTNIQRVTGSGVSANYNTRTLDYFGGLIGRAYGYDFINMAVSIWTLTLQDIHLDGLNFDTSTYSGGILASGYDIHTSLSNVHAKGILNSSYSGGLIGTLTTIATLLNHSISNSSFEGELRSGGGGINGGLVGSAQGNSTTIANSFAKFDSSVWSGTVAGLLGSTNSDTTISDSYAQADLTSTHVNGSIGGLGVGFTKTLTINRSYFAGTLTPAAGSANNFCFVGAAAATLITIQDSHYDSDLCAHNATSAGPHPDVTAETTSSLQSSTAFTNWLSSDWVFTSGAYPQLAWE